MKKDQRAALIVAISAIYISVTLAALDVEEQAALKAIRDHVPGLTTAWSDTVISEACQTYSSPSYASCSAGHISEIDFTYLWTRSDSIGTLGNITGLRFLKSLRLGPAVQVKDLDIWYSQLANLTSLQFSNTPNVGLTTPKFSANFTNNPFFNTLQYYDYNTSVLPWKIIGAPGLQKLLIYVPKLSSLPNNFLMGLNLTELSFAYTGSLGTEMRSFPDFSHMAYLKYLDLSNTLIQELQDNFTSLVRLRELKLDRCYDLFKIPPSVSNCIRLEALSCDSCRLNRTDSVPNLSETRLKSLSLYNNSITTWPGWLCQLSTNPQAPGLSLLLQGNALTNPPACFANTVGIFEAFFSNTDFTSFPSVFASTDIWILTIYDSYKMRGGIPDLSGTIGHLDIRRCGLDGNFPRALPTSLVSIKLTSTKLRGVIADGVFAGLRSLISLDLTDNDFVGPFPSSIGDTQLKWFSAANNAFTTLPNSMGRLTGSLSTVDFNGNNLNSIPSDEMWFNMTWLTEVRLNSNRNLNGPLLVFWNTPNSRVNLIDLSGCSFTGNVPSINSTGLKTLLLSNNALDGSIPPNIYEQNLVVFRADRNSLSGSIPSRISASSSPLEYLDVSFNRLTGSIPDNFSIVLTYLSEFSFNNNAIEGTIPGLASARNLNTLNGYNTNIRLCEGGNPNFGYTTSRCNLYNVKFPGSCGCESWYTRCVTNTTCPPPDYVDPVIPPGAAAPTPVLPPGSSALLPPGVPPPLTPLPPPIDPYSEEVPEGSATPSSTEPASSEVPVGSATAPLASLFLLIVSSIGIMLF